MRISVAQIRPIKGDLVSNIGTHTRFIEQAVSHKADAIFFPELSLTGYEPELAKGLAVTRDDKLFDCFQKISTSHNITIGLGMPIKFQSGIQISMVIFQPFSSRQVYSKQQLHTDELPYFVKGEEQLIVTFEHIKIAPAICYESLQADHAAHAHKLGAEIYLASVAKSQSGIDKARIHYPAVAKKFHMAVFMSNCVGHCDNFESVGQTAIWTKKGELAAQLDSNSEGILIFDTDSEEVFSVIL